MIFNQQPVEPNFTYKALFNPQAKLRIQPLFDGFQCIVIDDFLRHPQAIVDFATANQDRFRYDSDNHFPGIEMDMGKNFALNFEQYFMLELRRYFGVRRQLGTACRISITNLAAEDLNPLQRLCHRDAESFPPGVGMAAAVVYLFRDAALGGTGFYRPKQSIEKTRQLLHTTQLTTSSASNALLNTAPAYLSASNDYFELVQTIPAKWNRAIFYTGTVFHAAHITQAHRLSSEPNTGRLALNGFFKFKQVMQSDK